MDGGFIIVPDSDIDGDPVDKFVLILDIVFVEHSETDRLFDRATCLCKLSNLLLRYRFSRCNFSKKSVCRLNLSSRL